MRKMRQLHDPIYLQSTLESSKALTRCRLLKIQGASQVPSPSVTKKPRRRQQGRLGRNYIEHRCRAHAHTQDAPVERGLQFETDPKWAECSKWGFSPCL